MKTKRCTDLGVLCKLNDECFPEDIPPQWSKYKWWVIWDGDTPAAFCGLSFGPDHIYLVRAGVSRPYRGKGLQRRMIKWREHIGRKYNAPYSITYTLASNVMSNNNLIKSGYLQYTPEYAWEGRDHELIYWRKEL